ncbi:hypothetical protein BRARA_A02355 [Brassica rapa]|uniref:Transposase-associated domain-containing protein n=1 Tax=Brassica campestris TaxID=3711 RepID=A0A398ARW0_BRACM|nr:hypothetical protein BRARA_A02355 [Brassica rapa]
MDQRIDPGSNCVSETFLGGIDAFIQYACNQADYKERETLLCPCARCKNVKQREERVVTRHLFLYGLKGNYYVWTSHGEKFYDVGESSGANHSTDHHQNIPEVQEDIAPPYMLESIEEMGIAEPYHDSVFEAFEAATQPLYEGCAEGISQLSLASRMISCFADDESEDIL